MNTEGSSPLELTQAGASCRDEAADVYFARVGRDGLDELHDALRLLQAVPMLQEVIDAMPLAVSVVNEKGQTVLINRYWRERHDDDPDCGLGSRHGELLGCIHAAEGPDGCGTSHHCDRCGAAISIVTSRQKGGHALYKYRLEGDPSRGHETAELRVSSTALRVDGQQFFIFAVQDLAPRKMIEDSLA